MFGFKFHLVSPHYVPDSKKDFFNYIYKTWYASFTEVVESAGGKLDPDDFFRCDHVGVITFQDKIVSLSTLTLFDIELQSSKDHHYFKALNESTCQALVQKRIKRLLSIEYLNVLPEFRRHQVQSQGTIPWVEVMMGLNSKIMDQSDADIIIGTPRIDLKVDVLCRNVGAEILQDPITKMNYPCAVMIIPKNPERHFPNPVTEQYVTGLWKSMEVIGREAFAPIITKKTA